MKGIGPLDEGLLRLSAGEDVCTAAMLLLQCSVSLLLSPSLCKRLSAIHVCTPRPFQLRRQRPLPLNVGLGILVPSHLFAMLDFDLVRLETQACLPPCSEPKRFISIHRVECGMNNASRTHMVIGR